MFWTALEIKSKRSFLNYLFRLERDRYNSSRYIFRLSQRLASRLWRSTGIRGSTHFYYIWKCSFFVSDKQTGLHKLWHPSIRDTSMWSKFGAHGEHGDVFPFSNLGALWFSENLIRYSLHVCLREVKNNLFFLQILLFTAFLVTVLKNLTYALVSTRSSVSSRWEHVKRKMHLWFQLRLWWNVCICVLASYSCSNFHEVDMFASSLYFVKVYMFASSLLSLFVLDRVLDLRSVVAPLI